MRTAGADGGGGGRAPAPALALLVLVTALAAPAAARAAGEPGTQLLPGDAHSVAIVDLESDGVKELVRIVATEDPRVHLVEAWGFRDDGWELIGSAPIPRLDPDRAGPGNVRGPGDGSAVIPWRADGRVRALVVVSCCIARSVDEVPTCCLAAYELIRTHDGVMLEARIERARPADVVHVIDADADGTDELVRNATSFTGETGEIEVLRRDDGAFTSIYRADVDGVSVGLMSGDTDGAPGQDILLGPQPDGNLRRIAWVDGALHVEEAHLDLGERFDGYITGVAGGAIVLSMADQLQLVSWPRGERPVLTARLAGLIYPFAGIVEAGSSTVIALQGVGLQLGQQAVSLGIYDLELRELGRIDVSPTAARVERLIGAGAGERTWERYLFPYSGPLDAAAQGQSSGFVWAGTLVQADGDEGYRAQPIAPFLGLQPIGLAGPDDGWIAVSSGYLVTGSMAYLYAGFVAPGFGRISLVPIEDVLRPEDVAPVIELRHAVAVGRTAGDVTQLVADGEGFEVVVRAPVGSWVVAREGRSFDELTVGAEPLVLEIPPPRARDDDDDGEDEPIDASLIIAKPDGHATVVEWSGTFVGGPPALSVSDRSDAFSFSATVEGSAGRHATVSVDGRTVAVGADGDFSAPVEAGLWPRTVVVSATDPLGNEAVERLEVVGVFDYRGLPWAAIVGAATVGVGAVLFVRIPRRRMPVRVEEAGDGRLEELDPIDGTSFGER